MNRYWLTPPELYARLDSEFHFDYDPCPFPRKVNALLGEWGNMNYVNAPFRSKDGSPTAFVRKAIEQQGKGRSSVLVLPTQSYVNLLLEAGAELRSLGRVRWLEVDTKVPMPGPSPITMFILKGKAASGDSP